MKCSFLTKFLDYIVVQFSFSLGTLPLKVVSSQYPELRGFESELKYIDKAAQFSLENIMTDVQVRVFIHTSLSLSLSLCFYLIICISNYLSICISIYLSIYPKLSFYLKLFFIYIYITNLSICLGAGEGNEPYYQGADRQAEQPNHSQVHT